MAPSPLRIALLHYSAPPVVGGVESVLAHHAELMTAAGHEVSIIAGRGQPSSQAIPLRLVPMADSRHPDILTIKAELDAGRVPPAFEPAVVQLADSLRPLLTNVDIVIAHNVCSLNKNLPLTASLHRLQSELRAPALILWHHDLAWTTPRYRPELHDGYPWDLLRTPWPGAHLVTVSEARRFELAGLLGIDASQITVAVNGVSVRQFHKLEQQTSALIEPLELGNAEPLLLLPVRLTPRKNIELAVEVLALLRRRWPRAALVVTGPEGPHNPANAAYRQKLLALRNQLDCEHCVHFLVEHVSAYLPDAVIADFFRLADALLLPSREEGFGIPLIEAALSRLPVFCSDIPQLRELGGSEVAFFTPDASPDVVADLIYQTLSANASYRFAVRARQSYSWQTIYNHTIEPLLKAAVPAC